MVIPVGIALMSRAFSTLLVVGLSMLDDPPRDQPLTMWDGQWYLGIASDGYHSTLVRGGHDYAFFPAWPALIRATSLLPFDPGTSAVIAANGLFVLAAVALWRLVAGRFDTATASAATALLAFSPPAFVFSLAYSESLFLALACLQFAVAAGSLWRGPIAALATLTRITGLAVVASAAYELWGTPRTAWRGALAAVIGGIGGFVAWWLFIAVLSGDPLGYLGASSRWIHENPVVYLLKFTWNWPVRVIAWCAFVGVVIAGTALLYRRDGGLFVYAAVALVIAMLPLIAGGFVHSLPRYAVLAFPAFAGLADRLGRRGSATLLVIFVIGQVFFVRWAVAVTGSQSP